MSGDWISIEDEKPPEQEKAREGESICRDCYIKCCRLAVKLDGGMVPMDALGCSSGGNCDRYLIDFLKKLMKREKESRLKSTMNWISIEDEKPPEHIWIIGGNPQRVEFGVWMGEKKGFCLPDLNYLCLQITHWMHRPKPPKESKDADLKETSHERRRHG